MDSLSFLLAPLSALPKMFGFGVMKKGFFPHAFNTPENQNYVGPHPAREYYDPENMKGGISERTGEHTGEIAEFYQLYCNRREMNMIFNLPKMYAY